MKNLNGTLWQPEINEKERKEELKELNNKVI